MERGEKGYPLCRFCNEEVPSARRTFCSNGCVHEHRVGGGPRKLPSSKPSVLCSLLGGGLLFRGALISAFGLFRGLGFLAERWKADNSSGLTRHYHG